MKAYSSFSARRRRRNQINVGWITGAGQSGTQPIDVTVTLHYWDEGDRKQTMEITMSQQEAEWLADALKGHSQWVPDRT